MTGRIVVGVDGSEGSVVALRWAANEADLHDASVDVVHAWHYPYAVTLDLTGRATAVLTRQQVEETARTVLDRSIRHARPLPAGVHLERLVVEGQPVQVVLDAATGADMLVVGSRGRGGFTGLLLGSVSQQCLHHGSCPVAVVPGPERPELPGRDLPGVPRP